MQGPRDSNFCTQRPPKSIMPLPYSANFRNNYRQLITIFNNTLRNHSFLILSNRKPQVTQETVNQEQKASKEKSVSVKLTWASHFSRLTRCENAKLSVDFKQLETVKFWRRQKTRISAVGYVVTAKLLGFIFYANARTIKRLFWKFSGQYAF